MLKQRVASIYVSHNSELYINQFGLRHVRELGETVYVVNSYDSSLNICPSSGFEVIDVRKNIGFSAANNLAIGRVLSKSADLIMIINPDVLLPPGWLHAVVGAIDSCPSGSLFTVPLLGYDFKKDMPTGLVDSAGIYSTWYGKWFDKSRDEDVDLLDSVTEVYDVPAACGALIIFRKETIQSLLDTDGYVFNESYFMYKEDIELSIRIRRMGKKIMMLPAFPVFHCRGWKKDRSDSPYWARKLSARNELRLNLKYYWRFLPYSLLKYFYVNLLEEFRFKLIKSAK